jgi:shikimate kinase
MNVVLIGLRGSGKTTCGRLLARRLGWVFVDTDTEIQERAGAEIRRIFETEGEAGFRKREAEVVREMARLDRAVIATGGGAVLDKENVSALRGRGFVVHLSAPAEELWRRVSGDPKSEAERPALVAEARNGLEELARLLEARAGAYREARDVELVVLGRSPEELVSAILVLLRVRGLQVP